MQAGNPGGDDRWEGAALATLGGLGPRRLAMLHEALGSWSAAWDVGPPGWPPHVLKGASTQEYDQWLAGWRQGVANGLPQRIFDSCRRHQVTLLTWDDDHYPAALRHLDPGTAPPFLFVRGPSAALSRPSVAVVGTRRPTPYGLRIAREISQALARLGVVVVSGLAFGIDTAAHEACLDAGGATVAVLAGGPERATPRSQQYLYDRLLVNGAVVSQYPPGTLPNPGRFPARNRVMAALSQAVIVVEAPQKSGALITARHANDIGRPVFAVPASLKARSSRGCLELLREGAAPFLELDDVLAAIKMPAPRARSAAAGDGRPRLTGAESLVYAFLDVDRGMSLDAVVEGVNLEPAQVMAALTGLELKGLCVVRGGAVWRS